MKIEDRLIMSTEPLVNRVFVRRCINVFAASVALWAFFRMLYEASVAYD